MATHLTDEEKQDAFNKVIENAAASAKSIPAYMDFLVMNLRDKPAELQYWVDRLIKELESAATIKWHTSERDAALKKLKPFMKTPEQLSSAGKKGKRLPDTEMLAKAKQILTAHPIKKNATVRNIQKQLNIYGLSCGKTWVSDHKKEILSAITPA